jgi:hypothetical protein
MAYPYRQVVGWGAVGVSTLLGCFWAFWGILENFHEGWYYPTLPSNLALMVCQYLLPMLLFVAAGLMAVRWPWLGAGLHAVGAGAAAWFFRSTAWPTLLPFVISPLLLLALGYGWGRPQPRRWAAAVLLGLPLVMLVICGAGPAIRVAGRWDDGDRGIRHLAGNGVDLLWAPAGPGWPAEGVSWDEALRRCRYLTADGSSLAGVPQDLWPLPTVEEAVRSACRHGRNCSGTWDTARRTTLYTETPDKESPLWDIHSPVVYWWTATEVNEREACIMVYNGQVWPRPKRARWGYLAFRAVREGCRCPAPRVESGIKEPR